MSADDTPDGTGPAVASVAQALDTPDLGAALESERFKQFLDQVPVAIAVAELTPQERVIYTNVEFERLTEQTNTTTFEAWERLPGVPAAAQSGPDLGRAVTEGRDYLGAFTLPLRGEAITVDAWSNIVEDEAGEPAYRLVALVELTPGHATAVSGLEEQLRLKDTRLQELQHRVKNNLQMITALIRAEARAAPERALGTGFDRLAGRVEALGLLYDALSHAESSAVDLGIYLSSIASAVMRAHAVEGIRLDLRIDTWPVSVDIAMPAGLVVNELMTNALKHAFEGRAGGTITLHSTTGARGFSVVVADDGVGLPEGVTWPKAGKLSAMIVRSLVQNARARIDVHSAPGEGTRVTIGFNYEDAAA
jgi:two-component sensor histidine kinase